jgi:hypothetical protein
MWMKWAKAILILLLSGIGLCLVTFTTSNRQPPEPTRSLPKAHSDRVEAVKSWPNYFPPGVLDREPGLHYRLSEYFSRHLFALREEPVYALTNNPTAHIYRFLCLGPSHPYCITLEIEPSGEGRVTLKMASIAMGHDLGMNYEATSNRVAVAQVAQSLDILEREAFWDLPGWDDVFGFDGSRWVVEGVKDGRYHVVQRWTPDSSNPVGRLGRHFHEVANWEPTDVY